MIRAAILALMLTGCATPLPVDCRMPEPPAGLLTVPMPLPPVPADLPRR